MQQNEKNIPEPFCYELKNPKPDDPKKTEQVTDITASSDIPAKKPQAQTERRSSANIELVLLALLLQNMV